MTLSVLIVCYNSKDYIGKCLDSFPTDGINSRYEILLLDNSSDGTTEFVKRAYPFIRVMNTDSNLGFARGNNELARYAKGEYLFLLNPDTSFEKDCFMKTLETVEKGGKKVYGHVTYYPGGRIEPSSLQLPPGILNNFVFIGKLKKIVLETTLQMGIVRNREVVSGAAMIIERELWNLVGGFDPTYFMYSEEVDLCHRLRKATGKKARLIEGTRVTHYVGKSFGISHKRNLAILTGQTHYSGIHFSRPRNSLFKATLLLNIWIKYFWESLKRGESRDDLMQLIKEKKTWMNGYAQSL